MKSAMEEKSGIREFEHSLKDMPLAGQGLGFNDDALPRAARLAKNEGIPADEAIRRIIATQKRAGRAVEAEVESTVRRIYEDNRDRRRSERPPFPEPNVELIETITSPECSSVENLKALSPVKEPDTIHPKKLLEKLFPGDPLVTIGKKVNDEKYSSNTNCLSAFDENSFGTKELVVPSPAIRKRGFNQAAKPSDHCKELYVKRQNLVVEFDCAVKDKAATFLWHLGQFAPLVMVVDSGNKSLHGWFCCQNVPEEDALLFFQYAASLGADRKMWDLYQFARLPGGVRYQTGAKQNVLYWNPDVVGGKWNLSGLPTRVVVRSIMDIPEETPASETNIVGERFLTRGRAISLVGPTGLGKSSLLMQMLITWAIGKEFMGIKAERPLRSLIIQAENDDEDMRAMRDGIIEGLGLDEHVHTIMESVHYCTLNVAGDPFLKELEPLLKRTRPDIVALDPLFAFIGHSAVDQEKVSGFLRRGLQPLLEKYNVGCIINHHTNKPPSSKRDRPDWNDYEFAYFGSGSAEIANWLRGGMALRSIGDTAAFELIFGKRHKRTGLRGEDGKPVKKLILKHSPVPNLIYWELGKDEDALPPDHQEKLESLGRAYHKLAEQGEVKRAQLAKEMCVSVKTIDRMFKDQDFLWAPVPGAEKPIRLRKCNGFIYELAAEGGVRCRLRSGLRRDTPATTGTETQAA